MNFQDDNNDWQIQGSSFVSKTLRKLSVITDRINLLFNLNAKWLNTSLYSKQSQLENEGKNYSWLHNLVNRLEHPSNLFLSGFQRNGYESARTVKYRWFDPRYWMEPDISDEINEAGNIDSDAVSPDEARKKIKQPLSGIRDIQRNAARIVRKYDKNSNIEFNLMPAEKPELQLAEPFNSIIQTDNNNLKLPANVPLTNIPFSQVSATGYEDLALPAMPVPVTETENLSGMDATASPAEIQNRKNDVIEKEPGLQEIWNESPIARRIENNIKRIIKSVYKKESSRVYSGGADSHRQGSFVTQFLRKYFKNMDYYPESEESVLPEPQPLEQTILHNIPAVSQERGIFSGIAAETMPEMPVKPVLGLNEFGVSIPFEMSTESIVNVPFKQFSQPSEVSLPLPVPVMDTSSAVNSFLSPVSMPALSAGISSGKGNGPVYLAMAPLLRPMPEELRGGEEETPSTTESQVRPEEQNETEYDPEQLAAEVYSIIKRRLLIEQERNRGSI